MAIILAPGTTDSATSDQFTVRRRNGQIHEVTISLYPEANVGSDTAVLKTVAPDGSLVSCTDDNGVITLSATRLTEVVVGPGRYALTVGTRTLSWGISITGNDD